MKPLSALIVCLSIAGILGCMNEPSESQALATKDHDQPRKANCFKKILAGEAGKDGKLLTVAYAEGSCQGGSKAIDRLMVKKSVVVVQGSDTFESELFQTDGKVYAVLSGQRVQIATLNKNPDEAAMKLRPGASVELRQDKIYIRRR